MNGYISWYNGLNKVWKIVLAVLGIFCLLYRLFYVIREKASNTGRLVYLILNFVPVIGTVLWAIDIAFACKDEVPLSFEQLVNED